MSGAVHVALVLSGCGLVPATSCSDVGAVSGIVFEFSDVLAAHRGEALLIEGCVRSTCDTLAVGAGGTREHGLAIGQDVVDDDSPVPVALRMTDRRGRTVFDGRLMVTPVKQQPNGPGCPPVAWSARVTATGERGLLQIDRQAD